MDFVALQPRVSWARLITASRGNRSLDPSCQVRFDVGVNISAFPIRRVVSLDYARQLGVVSLHCEAIKRIRALCRLLTISVFEVVNIDAEHSLPIIP